MKIFEFHFNPGGKTDSIFDSFCYEPSTRPSEQKLGSLYIIGELQNALPQDVRLLNNLAFLLKREYYSGSSGESALKKALKKANDFLSEKAKTGNVNWLGNLSLAVISLKDLDLTFSKDGKIKILLLRPGHITDIGKTLEIEEFEPYPLKIFTNIIGGKFLENDKIIILTEGIFEFFSQTALLEKIAAAQDQRSLKELFNNKEKEFSGLRGLCFLLFLTKETSPKSDLTFKRMAAPLSLKEVLSPFRHLLAKPFWRKVLSRSGSSFSELKFWQHWHWPQINPPRLSEFSFPKKLGLSRLKPSLDWEDKTARKNLFLIFVMISFLILGFFFSQREAEMRARDFRERLIGVQEKVIKVQGYLDLNQGERANRLLREAFQEVLPLSQGASPVGKEALVLKKLIEKDLTGLSHLEELPDPEVLFSFESQNFLPQHLIVLGKTLYFFSPYEKELARLTEDNQLEKILAGKGFSLATTTDDEVVFFTKPNEISIFSAETLQPALSLKLPDAKTSFVDFSSYKKSFYFLEKDTGKIFKYQYPLTINREQPQSWIQAGEKKPLEAKSMVVSGSVFVLTEDDSLWEYQAGRLKKAMDLSVFPFPKRLTKLVVWPPFLGFAILEPSQGRVILIDRSGSLVQQFQSQKFLSLKDAAFSEDGKSLYLLSGSTVYRVNLSP